MKWILYIFLIVYSKAYAENRCNVRESVLEFESDDAFYTLECTITENIDLADLSKSARIHSLDDEIGDEGGEIRPQFVDELNLHGDIKEIPANAFKLVPNLSRLRIDSSSNSTKIPNPVKTYDTSFAGIKNLTSLTLITRFAGDSANVFPDSLITVGSNLQQLIIEDADLNGELGGKHMKNLPNLKSLVISNSPKLKLANESGLFSGMRLEKLVLKNLDILQYPESLKSLKTLQRLHLANMRISEFSTDAFANLASTLIELRVEKCPIKQLDPGVLKNLKFLKTLSLANNEINALHPNAFSDLEKLEDLNLSGNQLQSVPDGIFKNLNRLRKLDLSKNHLTNITQSQMQGLEMKLAHLDLSENSIRAFRATNMSSQLGLSLASNGIDTLKKGFFQPGSAFNRLILSSNPLTQIEFGAFSGLTIGESMHMNNASFEWFDLSVFQGLKSDAQSDGTDQMIMGNCPELMGVNLSRPNAKWSHGLKQIVFMNNPKFTLIDPDGSVDELISFAKRNGMKYVLDGTVYCGCKWNWLTQSPFDDPVSREEVVVFGSLEEANPPDCCNIGWVNLEDFLDTHTFKGYCNGLQPLANETTADGCPQMDVNDIDEPEARRK